jgi:hypothetical protein
MRRGIIVLLAASAATVAAEEPQAPVVSPPNAAVEPAVPADRQSEALRLLKQYQKATEESERPRAPPPVVWSSLGVHIPLPGRTCYFIRTLVPEMPDADVQRKGFIPLQARVNAVQRGPDCSNRGQLAPLIPTGKP